MEFMIDAGFWISVLKIIAIDVLLGGDNAVVIAMACRRLPEALRRQAIWGGVAGAVVLRVVMIFFALQLLALPYLKIVGGIALLWIGYKLLASGDDDESDVDGGTTLLSAIKTVVIADAVMSIDNVIAVAAAAGGNLTLVVFGIVVSIPLIVWGSRLVLALMDRFKVVIVFGGGLLGWIGGEMILSDPALRGIAQTAWQLQASGVAGALMVVLAGSLQMARARRVAVRVAPPGSRDTPGD